MNKLNCASILVCLAVVQLMLPGFSFGRERPNVIVIMTDDQGYGDLSITGNVSIETPNMDRIATEGAWFKQFYVSPVCTPTRAHLMTGRYAYRTRAFDTYLGRANMEPEEVTVAELLGEAGYSTGIFGKWHLGDYYPTRAMDQGFQESLVHQGGGLRQPANPREGERYHDPILFHNGQPKRYEGYCTDIFFDEAINFVEQKSNAGEPFFAYISTNAPHSPFDEPPTRELLEQFRERFPDEEKDHKACFYAMVKNVDDNMGRLLSKLEQLNIEQNTLVVFLTDNGPSSGSAGPFRGKKGTIFEGGIRTVCFMRWPGRIEAGCTSDQTTAHIDLMPTILDVCEVAPPASLKLDGRSLRPFVSSNKDSVIVDFPDRHLILQWHRGDVPQSYHHFATIGPHGRWKLLASTKVGQHQLDAVPEFELYDLQNDIAETTNVADQNPEIVETMKQAYDVWFEDVTHTREPNFGMPPIVIGSDKQRSVTLTPQDKRVDEPGSAGWNARGHWPVEIQKAGPFTIEVILAKEADEDTNVNLTISAGDEQWTSQLTVLRGVNTVATGSVELPIGSGRVVVRVDPANYPENYVYQVKLK